MCASTEAESSWTCLGVNLLGVFMPTPARRLILGDVIGEGCLGGVNFLLTVYDLPSVQ